MAGLSHCSPCAGSQAAMMEKEARRISERQEQRVAALTADMLKMYEDCKRTGAIVEVSAASDRGRLCRSTNDLFDVDVPRTRGAAHRIRVGRTRSRSASPSSEASPSRETREGAKDGRRFHTGRSKASSTFRTHSRSASPSECRSKELARAKTFSLKDLIRGKEQRRDLVEKDHSHRGAQRLGLRWIDVGHFRPAHGTELSCDLLAVALPRQLEFTPAELGQFKLGELQRDSYVKARNGRFYQPEQERKDNDKGIWDWVRAAYLKFYIPAFRNA